MADPFIGEIALFPYNFAPENYLLCAGQVLQTSQYQALYALLGNTYGGTAPNTFALPNLIGTVAVGVGQFAGGAINWEIGDTNGAESVTLAPNQYPSHNHTLSQLVGANANVYVPVANAALGNAIPTEFFAAPAASANTTMHPDTLLPYAGGGAKVAPHENRQPFLVLMPCIATSGVYPTFPS